MSVEVRLAEVADLEDINKLIWSPGVRWFGNIRPKYRGKESLFHTYQTHRMLAISRSNDALVAYAEFRNYPNISALPSDCWMEWLSGRYCLTITISWLNALFCNFCIYKKDYPCVIAEFMKEVFYRENRVWYLIAVRTPNVRQPSHYTECFEDLAELAHVYFPREFSMEDKFNTQSLYIVDRFERMPRITYRKALAEDNDDIIAIQEVDSPELRQELGDFYIAEEVMRQDPGAEKNLLIVGELFNQCQETEMAIFQWLTTDIDIPFYVRNYEMEAYGNLVKHIAGRSFHCETMTVSSVKRRSPATMFTTDAMQDLEIQGGIQQMDGDESNSIMREALHSKFKYIIDKLSSREYYMRHEQNTINFMYVAGAHPKGPKAIEAASNVFVLKCIVARQDFPLSRLFNSMVAMFCAYPDRDYCLMLVSKRDKAIRSHIEVLQYFMPVVARPSTLSDRDEVFITHRSTIFGEISMYKMTKEDVPVVHSLALGNLPDKDHSSGSSDNVSMSYCSKIIERADLEHELHTLDKIMKDVLENEFSEFAVFTIRCGNSTRSIRHNTPIGYVVIRQFHSYSKLFDHYHLSKQEKHLDRLRAEIISLRLHPLFLGCSDQIFRDLARKTNFYDFYFITSFMESKFGNDLRKMMMVLEPRPVKKAPVFFMVSREVEASTSRLNLVEADFAKDYLVIYRHKLNPTKRFTSSRKLLIIGFTGVTRAFLRQLVFQWNSKDNSNADNYTCLSWPEVTVICRPGVMEAEYDSYFKCPYCPDTRGCYLSYQSVPCYVRDCCVRMDLRYWVHFVPGNVEAIYRERKCVKSNSCEIYYDQLLILCARSFVLKAISSSGTTSKPCNFVEPNFRMNKLLLFYKLQALLEDMSSTYLVVVYGSNLSTYACISFLISHGINCSQLVLVLPHRYAGKDAESKLKNPYFDTKLQLILNDILVDSGVTVLEEYNFHHWVLNESSNSVTQVVFEHFPRRHQVSYECDLFISFEEGHLLPRHKKWLGKAKIELDGNEILVNERFQTNDPDIYAAGNFIKLRQECNYQYKFVSERETARKLLHHLGIEIVKNFEDRYSEPVHFQAILPLGYFITKMTMPRRYLSAQLPMTPGCYMTTYKDSTFCRVGLSSSLVVDEIVVVTKLECHLDFLQHFCGKHELLLNNLRARFRARTIDNFLKWFQEPWTELIMHEKFDELQAENRNLLRAMALANLSKNRLDHDAFKDVTDTDFYMLNKRYMEQKLLNFLRQHRNDFRHKFALPEDFLMPEISGTSWDGIVEASTETDETDETNETTEMSEP